MIIGTNFKLSSKKFLDDRQQCPSLNDLIVNANSILYPQGFEVYCIEEKSWYQNVSEGDTPVWEKRKVGTGEGGDSASIDDTKVSSTTTWSSEYIYSMQLDLENLISQNEDYIAEVEDRLLYVEGRLTSIGSFDGSYDSLTNKPEFPSLENYATKEYIDELIANIGKIEGTKDYNELINQPINNIAIEYAIDGRLIANISHFEEKKWYTVNTHLHEEYNDATTLSLVYYLEEENYKVINMFTGKDLKSLIYVNSMTEQEINIIYISPSGGTYELIYNIESYSTVINPLSLNTNNTLTYIPTEDYHPATKKYVDDIVGTGVPSNPSSSSILDFEGIESASMYLIDVSTLKINTWYKMPNGLSRIYIPTLRRMGEDGYWRSWTISNSSFSGILLYFLQRNDDEKTILYVYDTSILRCTIDWVNSTRTIDVINNTYEFEPTQDYNFTSKKYVDEAIENNSGGVTDYNDLENKPCYDNREITHITSFDAGEIDYGFINNATIFVTKDGNIEIDKDKDYSITLNGESYPISESAKLLIEQMGFLNFDLNTYPEDVLNNSYSLLYMTADDIEIIVLPHTAASRTNHEAILSYSENQYTLEFYRQYSTSRLGEGLIEISMASGELKQLDEKFIPDSLKDKDYNNLENRPCYKDDIVVRHTFDGNVEGKVESTNGGYIKISDATPTLEECIASAFVIVSNHTTGEIVSNKTVEELYDSGNISSWSVSNNGTCTHIEVLDSHVYIASVDNISRNESNYIGFPEKGIYINKPSYNQYISEFSIITGVEIKQLDEEFIPDTIARVEDLEGNGIVKPIEVFETENGFFGKTAYIDVDSMIPYVQYGLSEEYFDCPTIAFVVRTETKPYATVNLSIPSEVKNYMVTAKTTSNEVTSITLKSLNFDYKININNKATSSGVTTELIYNTNYLGTKNTREYTPTSDYHPATKKYVDDSLSNIEEYVTETELEEKGYLTEIPTEYITETELTNKGYVTETDLEEEMVFETDSLTVNSLGGISANTDLNGLTVKEILNKLLYPYIEPVITVSTTPNGSVFEKGNDQTITNVSVSITKKSEIITKIEVLNGTQVLARQQDEAINNGGTFNYNVNVSVPSTNKQLTVKVTDNSGNAITKTTNAFTFVYPYYYGICDEGTTINGDLIKSLTKSVETKGTKAITYTTNNQRMIFAYPKSYGVITKILDPNSFDVTATFSVSQLSILGLDGTAQSYYIYVNNPSTVQNFKMTFYY